MSQFKKYLEIVTEGKDYLYSEESESIEKYVNAARKLMTINTEKINTEKMIYALATLNEGLQNRKISEEEKEMVLKLLKNLKELGKSQSKDFMDEVHMYIRDIEITLETYKM